MSNTIGDNVKFTLFGESHGPYIGFTLDGIKAGIKIDYQFIDKMLSKRRPSGANETKRVENDNYKFISGIFNDYTTGAPICCIIENTNTKSKDYETFKVCPRPSHADYTSFIKYNNFTDYRGGGHFSGRVTCAIVLCAAIIIPYLKSLGIRIVTHIKQIDDIFDIDFIDKIDEEMVNKIEEKQFPIYLDKEEQFIKKIDDARIKNDSIGGVIQTAILGLSAGYGEPWFDSLEGVIAKSVFGIGGIKGIEFGKGFGLTSMYGSEFNDMFTYTDKVETTTNNNGGINGGISNGMPVVFNLAVKPTPSIYKKQTTVNLKTKKVEELQIEGRHDPAIIRRITIVITSIVAITLLDVLSKGNKNYIN